MSPFVVLIFGQFESPSLQQTFVDLVKFLKNILALFIHYYELLRMNSKMKFLKLNIPALEIKHTSYKENTFLLCNVIQT